ncbi:MAG: DUF721 domain-containing protein [Planctomycetaceae bacterium]|nr:DUF721 domain-containing protein [Planctomycetaceae bacterium]
MSKKGPERIGKILTRIMARYGFQQEISQEQLEKIFTETLGQTFTSQICFGSIRRGALEIFVTHPVLKSELSFRQTELLNALNRSLADKKIKRIKITIMS